MRSPLARLLVVAALLLGSAGAAQADTITVVTGFNDSDSGFASTGLFQNKILGVGFNTRRTVSNGEIWVDLWTAPDPGNPSAPLNVVLSLSAFLTTRVGPGTTAAEHEVASAFLPPVTVMGTPIASDWPKSITRVRVLSGLNLDAGSYFLTVNRTTPGPLVWWVSTEAIPGPVIRYFPTGVWPESSFMWKDNPTDPYLPANEIRSRSDQNFWYTLEGDLGPNVIPEPATLLLLGTGLIAATMRRRPRR